MVEGGGLKKKLGVPRAVGVFSSSSTLIPGSSVGNGLLAVAPKLNPTELDPGLGVVVFAPKLNGFGVEGVAGIDDDGNAKGFAFGRPLGPVVDPSDDPSSTKQSVIRSSVTLGNHPYLPV
jgi:hypothetical protein